nr:MULTISPECIES: hypothetical protein [unclassified Oceanispirochaeta]
MIRKSFTLIKGGYRCDFINPEESEDLSLQIKEALGSGKYDALITFYLSYHSLEIPKDFPVVLIGGSQEILYPSLIQIVSSDMEALRSVGEELEILWMEEGRIPLTVFWGKPLYAEEERLVLENSWNDENRHILQENWLNLDINSANSEKRLEDFFKKYDFESSKYIVFAYCAPVYKEFMRVFPEYEELPLILNIPENPVLPESIYGFITEDYLGLISEAVKSLKEDSPGDIIKVENKFIKK